jgi:hypothetical protein
VTAFCPVVSRISPFPYSSARRAISSSWSGYNRPIGTHRPTDR